MTRQFGILGLILSIAMCTGGVGTAQTMAATLDATDLHDVLVGQYMNGKWEDLEKDLTAKKPEIDKFSGVEAADMKYIRQTMAECRPAWWAKCKENQLFEFRPVVWGHGLRASFDPTQTLEWSIKFNRQHRRRELQMEHHGHGQHGQVRKGGHQPNAVRLSIFR